ncbi:MAG: hypothetical protein POG74_11415 [Acidocella sp.]|nr:hypothetical protein [Acidocella sp.]
MLSGMASPAMADGVNPWSLTLKAGGGYDSDVAINQIQFSSGRPDTEENLGLSTSYKLVNTPKSSISIGYGFSQSLYNSVKSFDLQSHDITLTASTKISKTTVGGAYSFYHILLGGRPFLNMQVVNPSLLAPVTKKVYFHGDILYLNESFLTDHTRDAAHYQPEFQLFYFFDNYKAFALFGAGYQNETTSKSGPEYAFQGYELKTSVTVPFNLFDRTGKVKAEYDWVSRDYSQITPSIGVKRYDRRSSFDLHAELPIVNKFSLEADYQYIDRISNLSTSNYVESLITSDIVYKF